MQQVDTHVALFFVDILEQTRTVRDEAGLIDVFVALSTTAIQGFEFSDPTVDRVDGVLEVAERIAHVWMAEATVVH